MDEQYFINNNGKCIECSKKDYVFWKNYHVKPRFCSNAGDNVSDMDLGDNEHSD